MKVSLDIYADTHFCVPHLAIGKRRGNGTSYNEETVPPRRGHMMQNDATRMRVDEANSAHSEVRKIECPGMVINLSTVLCLHSWEHASLHFR